MKKNANEILKLITVLELVDYILIKLLNTYYASKYLNSKLIREEILDIPENYVMLQVQQS